MKEDQEEDGDEDEVEVIRPEERRGRWESRRKRRRGWDRART